MGDYFVMENEYKNSEVKEDVSEENDTINEQETSEERTENLADTKAASKKEGGFKGVIIELCIYAAVIILCVSVVPQYVLQRTIVKGKSMMNNYQSGENLLVEKVSYRFSDPDRFDVIVFYPHGRESTDYYIKRVIGLPGETIQIKGDDIYINGKVIKENYGKDPMVYSGIAEEPLKLADDEFFVLGDNRTISEDSRYEEVGPVKRENIEGRAVFRIYPFARFGTVD